MSQKSTTTMVPGSYAWKIRSLDGLPLVGLNDLLHQAENESRYPLEHVRAEIIRRLEFNLPKAYCMDRDGIPRPIEGVGFGFITEAERQRWIQHDLEEAVQHSLLPPNGSEYSNLVSEPGWPALLRLLKNYWGKSLPSRPFIDLNRLGIFRSDDEKYEMADRILINQTDADRFFFEWLNPVEVDSGRNAESCGAARFEYASPYKGVALSSWPIGQHRLICLAQILDQVNGAGLMPSKANKKAIIQVLERRSPPCFYLGGSDGAESCDAFLFGWTSIEDAQGSVAQQRNDADWLKKDRMARQRDMPSGESVRQRQARARIQAGVDFMSYASAPGWPAILKRLKFDWLGEGVEAGFSAESVQYVAIKLTDADRLLGHLLPAAAPEQVMPAAPESQPVQGQQEGNHRQPLAQQYGLQPIRQRDEKWGPEMKIAVAVAFEELTKARKIPAGEAWEIVGQLCGGVSRPAMRKHMHEGVELKNERNRPRKSA